ncbi:hypothetical protein X946_5850 [Burkholderia sp. ABCPW 111]|nr:hypothetical protein X946_5850 [Burkholderia sp. ABCPW 111]
MEVALVVMSSYLMVLDALMPDAFVLDAFVPDACALDAPE